MHKSVLISLFRKVQGIGWQLSGIHCPRVVKIVLQHASYSRFWVFGLLLQNVQT